MTRPLKDEDVATWGGTLQAVPSGTADQCYLSHISVRGEDVNFRIFVPMLVWRQFESASKRTGKNWRDVFLESLTQYVQEKLETGEWNPSESNQEFRVGSELIPV